jgi:rhamnulokinase
MKLKIKTNFDHFLELNSVKNMSKYLAIDLGAASGRIIFGNLENQRLTISEDFHFSNVGVETVHGFHWDYLQIYSRILKGLATSVSLHGTEFDGIAVDTWGVDYLLLDKNGCPLAWPYHYRDNRTKN